MGDVLDISSKINCFPYHPRGRVGGAFCCSSMVSPTGLIHCQVEVFEYELKVGTLARHFRGCDDSDDTPLRSTIVEPRLIPRGRQSGLYG